ncbi:unnamed protein product [marine sediment metagenome]|uniref:Uncharacterized protein n=1 Tax=marine sediment metagenome TaxID=412755 RepID=X1S9D7_9ZZZZ
MQIIKNIAYIKQGDEVKAVLLVDNWYYIRRYFNEQFLVYYCNLEYQARFGGKDEDSKNEIG